MRVINLFAGPGAGKSTLAAALFAEAKRQGANVELVTEYAKSMVWEGRANILRDQLYILAKQNRMLHRLRGSVDFVITDSPLLLGLIYARPDVFTSYAPLVHEMFSSYDNTNLFLYRPPVENFSEVGRNENFAEAVQLDTKIQNLLADNGYDFAIASYNAAPASLWSWING